MANPRRKAPLFPTAVTDPKALKLQVRATDHPGQFNVENDFRNLEHFDREHVHFGGYFGTHGPHVFAAAPELLEAVIDLLAPLERASLMLAAKGKKLDRSAQASLDFARAAVEKAHGEAPRG
ncbi:hypothetical protein ACLIMP_04370 [Novosphingobium aerophilum]|uniref:hypothetical protein n=1 Tax=Novosphingobium aerophilum TaxID=2839843 RepID=UPI00163D79DF